MAATYTAIHKAHGKKVTGITAAQKQQMTDQKIAKNFDFIEEAGPEKPAVVKSSTSPAAADKPAKEQK